MLIRAEQIEELGHTGRNTFEARLLAHIEEFFPVHWREAGEERMLDVVRIGIANAASHGLETEREIYLFVSLMLYLGSYFDTDEQLPWAAAALNDASAPDAFARIGKTYDLATGYLARVAGPEGEHLKPAIEHFMKVAQELSRGSAAPVADVLRWTYPEKCRDLSEGQINQLALRGRICAQKYGLRSPQAALLCTELALLLGHGFADDPQFFWAAEVLKNPTLSDPEERLTALRDASLSHLKRWSAGAELAR